MIASPQVEQAAASTRTESQVREARHLTMVGTIRIGAEQTVAAEPHHPARDMPQCRWSGQHRFDLHAYESENTIEACMDCGKKRTYPTALNSAHCIRD